MIGADGDTVSDDYNVDDVVVDDVTSTTRTVTTIVITVQFLLLNRFWKSNCPVAADQKTLI